MSTAPILDVTGPEASYVRVNVGGTRNVVAACLAVGIAALLAVRRVPWLARVEGGE